MTEYSSLLKYEDDDDDNEDNEDKDDKDDDEASLKQNLHGIKLLLNMVVFSMLVPFILNCGSLMSGMGGKLKLIKSNDKEVEEYSAKFEEEEEEEGGG